MLRFIGWMLTALLAAAIARPAAGQGDDSGDDRPDRGAITATQPTDVPSVVPPSWTVPLEWRSIGPANMGGRITAIAVSAQDPSRWWAATASGGLLYTENNGITLEHRFDREATVSIGDVQVAASNHDVVWVGTGEANPRNSVSWGDGVYKSTDGGKTWKNMGLRRSYQIGRIAIHPTDPNIVYVGALGRLWGANPQRGLFKTTDGGKTWRKIHFVDDKTGVIDLQMHPTDPDTMLMATYERQRDGFDTNDPAKKLAPGSGLWKTTDGGETWAKITEGLPTCTLGRIGIDWYRKDPDVVYAIVESERIGNYPPDAPYSGILRGEKAEAGVRVTQVRRNSPAAKAGIKRGDIVLRVGDATVHTFDAFDDAVWKHKAGDSITVEIVRDHKSRRVELALAKQPKPRRNRDPRNYSSRPLGTRLGGQRENVQDKQGEDGFEYGGIYRSADAGETWTRINSYNPRPMYFSCIRVDPSDENHIFVGGVQLARSKDRGKTFTRDGGRGVHADQHALWINPNDGRHMILGCDGGIYVTHDRMDTWDHLNHVAIGQFYHVTVGPRANYRVYGGLQDNGSWGGPHRVRNDGGPDNADWFRIGGGDGFWCLVDPNDPDQLYYTSQNGNLQRWNVRTGERGRIRPRTNRSGRRGAGARSGRGRSRVRFNWETPFVLSAYQSQLYYTAGNRVFRSLRKGDRLTTISPNITRTKRGSASALAESPVNPDALWVGTDDGALWGTRDGGKTWVDMFTGKTAGAPPASTPAAAEEGAAEAAKPAATEGEKPDAFAVRLLERLRAADADGDGRVTKAEVPARLARRFARFDRNGDGVLDAAELRDTSAPKPAAEPEASGPKPAWAKAIEGAWRFEGTSEQMGGRTFTWTARIAVRGDGAIHGTVGAGRGESEIVGGAYDPKTKKLSLEIERRGGTMRFDGTVSGATIKGTFEMGDGRFTVEVAGRRGTGDGDRERAPRPGVPLTKLVPKPMWVSEIVASRHRAARAFVAFDGHRSDDDRPWIVMTDDYGRTWKSLRGNLPDAAGSVRTIAEDRERADVLYLGCEFGAWFSVDRGETWTKFGGRFPTVAVHAFAQHAGGDLVVGTHGRSLWVVDATPIRQWSRKAVTADATLYTPRETVIWRTRPTRGKTNRRFVGANPRPGVPIFFSLGKKAESVKVAVETLDGKRIFETDGKKDAGMHRVYWDLRERVSASQTRGRRAMRGRRARPGHYRVVLTVDGATRTAPLVISSDPDYHGDRWIELEDAWEEQANDDEEDGGDERP